MARVTVHKGATPSEEMVQDALGEAVVTDAKGRKIKLRKPGVLAQFRLVKIVGPESAKNETLLTMYGVVLHVAEIDGQPEVFPDSERELEAIIQRLDEHGLTAVMNGFAEHFGGLANPEEMAAQVKP